jgi:hypothetical protein
MSTPSDDLGWALVQRLTDSSKKMQSIGMDHRPFSDLADKMASYLNTTPAGRSHTQLEEMRWHIRRAKKLIEEI